MIKDLERDKVLLIGENGFRNEIESAGIIVDGLEEIETFSDDELTHF